MNALLGDTRVRIPLEDPRTMQLSPHEIERAQVIKQAVQADDALANLTDFEYVQWALVHPASEDAECPLPEVLQHIARMQAFKQEYPIAETIEEGVSLIDQLSLMLPGLHLAIEYLPPGGNCIAIYDWSQYLPNMVDTQERHALYVRGGYYRFHCMCPTFMAMRAGISDLLECQGVGWDNHNSNFELQVFEELFISYPKRHKEMFFVNSPTVMNIAYAIWKKYFNTNMKQTFHLGYQVPGMEGRRIDPLFKTPTPEVARQRMLDSARRLLHVRYFHQSTFALPTIT